MENLFINCALTSQSFRHLFPFFDFQANPFSNIERLYLESSIFLFKYTWVAAAKSLQSCLTPGDLPDPGIEPTSPALAAGSLSLSHHRSPIPPLTPTLHPHPFICHPSFPFLVKKGAESSKKTHQDHETNIELNILPRTPGKNTEMPASLLCLEFSFLPSPGC